LPQKLRLYSVFWMRSRSTVSMLVEKSPDLTYSDLVVTT